MTYLKKEISHPFKNLEEHPFILQFGMFNVDVVKIKNTIRLNMKMSLKTTKN